MKTPKDAKSFDELLDLKYGKIGSAKRDEFELKAKSFVVGEMDYSVKLELRIDWSEIDLFGHVNNLAILKYVQAARVNYLEKIGLMQLQSDAKIGPILASISSQFRKPLFYPGMVTVYSKVDYIKNTSFRIHHEIYDEKNEVAAIVQDIIVFYDFVKNVKLIIPDEIRGKIDGLESRNVNSESN